MLDIESTLDGAKCHRCGAYCTNLHENHRCTVRDLPISGKACYLRFIRRRDYTKRYEARTFHQIRENNITLTLTNLDTADVVDVLEKRTQDKLRARLEQFKEQILFPHLSRKSQSNKEYLYAKIY